MKKTYQLPLLLFASLVWIFSFQSCGEISNSVSDAKEAITDAIDSTSTAGTTSEGTEKSHSEMTVQEQSDYIATHSEHLSFLNDKMVTIKNETITKKDQFTIGCPNDTISIERMYNDKGEIHLLSYTSCNSNKNACSTKHHFFWEDKIIYQFYHHEVQEGGKQVVDDHKTFFKDGQMIKCLEKRYSYKKGENLPDTHYDMVDCVPLNKLTKNIEKLLTMTEEEAKTFFCK